MNKSLPRGIRLDRSPSGGVGDAAYLRNRNSVLRCEPSLYAARPTLGSLSYIHGLFLRNFCGDAFLTVLHRSVIVHIKLVISVCRPPKVFDGVISRVSVVMRHVGKCLVNRKPKKGNRNQSMGHPSTRLTNFISEYVSRVSEACFRALNQNRGLPPSKSLVRISPRSGFLSPRANLSALIDFVLVKSWNSFPRVHF